MSDAFRTRMILGRMKYVHLTRANFRGIFCITADVVRDKNNVSANQGILDKVEEVVS